MAPRPKPIPGKAREAWERGEEDLASKVARLSTRQLRTRLGLPGRGAAPVAASPGPAATVGAPPPQNLVRVPPRATATPSPAAPPPPSDPDPSLDAIGHLDTREEAEAIYRDVRGRMSDGTVACPGCGAAVPIGADPVRFASLAEKGLAAISRIEQIDKNRPRVEKPDEVTRRLVEVREAAERRVLAIVEQREAKLAADREAFAAWARGAFGEMGGAEAVRRVDAMLTGGA